MMQHPSYQIGPTPPPILPVLDPSEVEQTLYQRRETQSDALQPLQIYGNPYYAHAPQRSAPVHHNEMIYAAAKAQQNGTFSKTATVSTTVSTDKPTMPSTPPPPAHPVVLHAMKVGVQNVKDLVSVTPQSHGQTNNSASNHSTVSSDPTTTTLIESASHHSHSLTPSNAVPAPQLANPLPASSVANAPTATTTPSEQQTPVNYNTLIQRMYASPISHRNANAHAHDDLHDVCYANQNANHYANEAQPRYAHPEQVHPPQHPQQQAQYVQVPYAQGYYNGYAQGYAQPQAQYHAMQMPPNYYSNQPNTAPLAAHHYPNRYPSAKSADMNQYAQGNNNQYQPQQPQYGYYQPQMHHQNQGQPRHSHSHDSMRGSMSSRTPSRSHSDSFMSMGSGGRNSSLSSDSLSANVQYLQRSDGTIVSPHADPLTVRQLGVREKDEEVDPLSAGDDAMFGGNMVTLISVNWTTSIPFGTVRMHTSNRVHHVPLMDLCHVNQQPKKDFGGPSERSAFKTMERGRFRLGVNGRQRGVTATANLSDTIGANIGALISRRNPKLSDETLMKLPHLRKHREYIRTMDYSSNINMGPKDYNSFRVSVHSNGKLNGEDGNGQSQRNSKEAVDYNSTDGNGRTANIQNLAAPERGHSANGHGQCVVAGNLNKRNKKMCEANKGDLFKTELCENWVSRGHCTYGKKCHFAHGREDIRNRWRIENYKTQPCCDPARSDSRLCLFGKRCNYAHPGEPLRRSHHSLYLDEEYTAELKKDYGSTASPYPFGIYI